MGRGGGAAEITIKGLCGGPTAELLGVWGGGRSLGCPRGPVALDPPPLICTETMPEQEVSLLLRGLIRA